MLVEDKKALLQESPKKSREDVVSNKKWPRSQQVKSHGFLNPAQICYMNSCLQSLPMLKDSVQGVKTQDHVWRSTSDAAIRRLFMDIIRAHCSRDRDHKLYLLAFFKKVVSTKYEEFKDLHQKDAHEFSHLCVEPDEVFVCKPAADCCQHGQSVRLSGGRSHIVQDTEHQDLQELWCRIHQRGGVHKPLPEPFTWRWNSGKAVQCLPTGDRVGVQVPMR